MKTKQLIEKLKIKFEIIEHMSAVVIDMTEKKFIETLEEEIEGYTKDTQAEIGMGIYKIISERRKVMSDSLVLDTLINVCKGLINKSPECALEFSKQLEGYSA